VVSCRLSEPLSDQPVRPGLVPVSKTSTKRSVEGRMVILLPLRRVIWKSRKFEVVVTGQGSSREELERCEASSQSWGGKHVVGSVAGAVGSWEPCHVS
jgi:hypothetical protein